MNSTLDIMPVPEAPDALRRSQGMEFGSDDGAFTRSTPLTELPSFEFQAGPALCVPTGLPDASVRFASGV